MTETAAQRRMGIALVIASAVAFSTAPFFTRLLAYDFWTIVFWRGVFGGGLIAAIMLATQGRAGLRELAMMGKNGWLVAALATVAMVCFIPALQLTNVANVAVIIATGPFAAAALAWVWLREIPRMRTLVASLLALCGVAIIVSDAYTGAHLIGIGLACLMMLAIASMTVAVRRHRDTPMVAAAAISNLLGSLVSLPFTQSITTVTGTDLLILAMFGFFQVALGLTLFFLGSRLLPSGQASLIATLETPLMPFWVWLAFQEVPTQRTFIGGVLVMVAVVADIIGDIREQRGPASQPIRERAVATARIRGSVVEAEPSRDSRVE